MFRYHCKLSVCAMFHYVWVNSKSDHPPPGQTPGHLTFLKMPDQVPLYMGRFLGQMPHRLGLKSHRVGFFFFVFASSVYIKINEIHILINLKQFIIKDNA